MIKSSLAQQRTDHWTPSEDNIILHDLKERFLKGERLTYLGMSSKQSNISVTGASEGEEKQQDGQLFD